MQKSPKQAYTAEVKEQAVKRVKASKSLGAVAKEMGLVEQTLRNGVKAFAVGTLNGAGAAQVSRLRAENARLKGEVDILNKATAYFAREAR